MEVIDLTYTIEEGMPTFGAPWHPHVSIKQIGRIAFEGRETREVTFGTHTGTQIDAPLHFIKNGKSIDQIDPVKLVGPVVIVDLSDLGENGVVTKDHLVNIKFEKKLLFKFGWGKHWYSKKFYQNWPYFSKEAAEYLVSKKIELVGFDTPSPDDSRSKLSGGEDDSPIHKIFLANDVILVEYVANLEKVVDYYGWNIVALPLRIKGADGSPARICLYR
ncbi:cyclase family protein [Candidatus Micrarchaeota archaeon]|nr:cyclase family protein [Candidatus Micrarchaeota archaeon]